LDFITYYLVRMSLTALQAYHPKRMVDFELLIDNGLSGFS